MDFNRRQALLQGLFGAGMLGLRSLATGLPLAFLAKPLQALAEEPTCAADRAQYLVLCTSGSGDPLNANVPGTYAYPGVGHSLDPTMAKTPLKLGSLNTEAAKPWADLPQNVLDRTTFFHHTTLTNNHANQNKVMRLMGAVRRQEMLVSLYAKSLATCLNTVQHEPVTVGASGSGELLSYEGRTLPKLSPSGLRTVLARPTGVLGDLQKLRDQDLNRLNALLKERGTLKQRAYLDRLAQTQGEARALSQDLLDGLASITGDDQMNQVTAAALLIKMNVSPVISVRIGFGGDNHTDAGLAGEARAHVAGTATIAALYAKLASFGLQDKVTFAAMNVFGRTLVQNKAGGRDHLANHHVTVMIGKNVRPGVVGGIAPKGNDFTALPIDSRTGQGLAGADIPFEETLGAVGKTPPRPPPPAAPPPPPRRAHRSMAHGELGRPRLRSG